MGTSFELARPPCCNRRPLLTFAVTRKLLTFTLCLGIGPAIAYVPPEFQGDAPQPSARPVHGPIRPKAAYVGSSGGAYSPFRNHLRTYQGIFLTKSVFWGKEWIDSRYSSDKIAGIDLWYSGYTGSNYARTVDQYFWLGEVLDYQGHLITTDTGLGPGTQDDDIAATTTEICRLIGNHQLPLIPDSTFYPVYVAKKRPLGGACAVNATDICSTNGPAFSYAIIYNLDGDSGCDPGDRVTGHSQGLAAIANASARAVADQRTDWDFTGYYDEEGNEVDDKCAWIFNAPYVTFTNGSIWKLQSMWSNLAHLIGAGYPNKAGEKGCVDGR